MREWFAAEGLVYAPPPDVVSNTRLALELGEGARAEGLHRAYHDRVMDAYWAEGVDLSRRPALEELARGVGVSDEGIARALDDRAWAPAVDASTARAQPRRHGRARVRDRLARAGRRGAAARGARPGDRAGARRAGERGGRVGPSAALADRLAGAVEPLGRARRAAAAGSASSPGSCRSRAARAGRSVALRLDALGDDLEAEVVAERDDRAHDRGVVGVAVHVEHERAVDLELRDREPGEVGERRVAGAEVVDRDADAERLEPADDVRRPRGIRDDRALGDLDRQAVAGQLPLAAAGARPARAASGRAGCASRGSRRRRARCPSRCQRASCPSASSSTARERLDQAGLLGGGTNSPGGIRPRVGCCQRMSASTPASSPRARRRAWAGSGARARARGSRAAAPRAA